MAATVAIPRELRPGEVPLSVDAQQDVQHLQAALNANAGEETVQHLADRISAYYQQRTRDLDTLLNAISQNDFSDSLREHVFAASLDELIKRTASSMVQYLGIPNAASLHLTATIERFKVVFSSLHHDTATNQILHAMSCHSNQSIHNLGEQIIEARAAKQRLLALQASGAITSAAAPAASHPHVAAALTPLEYARVNFIHYLRCERADLADSHATDLITILSRDAADSIDLAARIKAEISHLRTKISETGSSRLATMLTGAAEAFGRIFYPFIIKHLIEAPDFVSSDEMGKRIINLAKKLKDSYGKTFEEVRNDILRALQQHHTLNRYFAEAIQDYNYYIQQEPEAANNAPAVPRTLSTASSCQCVIL